METTRVEDPRRRLRPLPELEDQGADGAEHRSFPRARMSVRLDLRVGPEKSPRFQASLDSENLSVSGAFVHSTFFLPLGTEMEVRFTLEDGEEISARAQVVREERPDASGRGRSGMGLRFLEFFGQSEVALARVFVGARLRAFVESYLKTKRAKKLGSEVERVVDALAAWELMQVRQPEDPWKPEEDNG
jgi:PilZ domain